MNGKNHIRFDWAAKHILRDKNNFGILEGFLSELLKEDMKITSLLESESNQETENDKFNRIDLYTENTKGEPIIVKIQNTREWGYMRYTLFGASKTEYLPTGSKYADIEKKIAVNIFYFDFGIGDDYIYVGETKFIGLHTQTELQLTEAQKRVFYKPSVQQTYPRYYVIRTTQFNNIIKDTLDEWIYFLKNSKVLDSFNAKGMPEVKQKLNVISLSDEKYRSYNWFLESLHDEASYAATIKIEQEIALEEAIERERKRAEQAVEEARQEERKRAEQAIEEIALNLLKTAMPDAAIAAITGLPETDIAQLRAKL